MKRETRSRLVSVAVASIAAACSGFEPSPPCTMDSGCGQASEYCNLAYGACFGRSGGAAIPKITGFLPGGAANQVMVQGTCPADATVRIFTNPTCEGTPAGMGTSDTTGAFTVTATVNNPDAGCPLGCVYATAESSAVGSLCTPNGTPYP